MKRKFYLIIFLLISFAVSGCSYPMEFCRIVMGTSTRKMERARKDAETKTFNCSIDECFDAVLSLTETYDPKTTIDANQMELYFKNRKKKHIVVMMVPGCQDTTTVGIFFDSLKDNKVKIDVASLSPKAQRVASELIFKELSQEFKR